MRKLILWDIDGTLIDGDGVSGQALRQAMAQVYGAPAVAERFSFAGKTDQQIVLETFADRQPHELLGQLDRLTELYLATLADRRDEMRRRGRVLDGVPAALARLAEQQALQTVLTGNLQQAAQLKLDVFDLSHFFDLAIGAFGSDQHRRRDDLVPIAVARAAQHHGRHFSGHEIVVIGDTPHDIACGKAGGARTVAVATGSYPAAALREGGPDAVLDSLADTDALLKAVFG